MQVPALSLESSEPEPPWALCRTTDVVPVSATTATAGARGGSTSAAGITAAAYATASAALLRWTQGRQQAVSETIVTAHPVSDLQAPTP